MFSRRNAVLRLITWYSDVVADVYELTNSTVIWCRAWHTLDETARSALKVSGVPEQVSWAAWCWVVHMNLVRQRAFTQYEMPVQASMKCLFSQFASPTLLNRLWARRNQDYFWRWVCCREEYWDCSGWMFDDGGSKSIAPYCKGSFWIVHFLHMYQLIVMQDIQFLKHGDFIALHLVSTTMKARWRATGCQGSDESRSFRALNRHNLMFRTNHPLSGNSAAGRGTNESTADHKFVIFNSRWISLNLWRV